MADYIDYPEKYEECGKKGRVYFKTHFTLENNIDSLEKLMKKLVDEYEVKKGNSRKSPIHRKK